jgi:signal transduction histidine kinase
LVKIASAASAGGRIEDQGLATRLAWITGLRLSLLVALLGATTFFYLRGDLSAFPHSQTLVFGTIGAGFVLAGAYAGALRRGVGLRSLALTQIILDQLTWTVIVYVSGGATSGATSFYGLTCLVAAVLLGPRGSAVAAVVGFGSYAALCGGFWLRLIVPPNDQPAANYAVTAQALTYPMLTTALGITVVAVLSGYLADRLRRTGGALVQARQRADEAERLAMLGRLAAGLAHEIRNPLGSISGSIEMLRESPELSDEDKQLCDIVRRETDRLNRLVTDMMDLARPRPPTPEAVDVVALAKDVLELARRSERGAGDVAVVYEGPDEPVTAWCDGAQIRQVLWNLVRNAVQASAAGSQVVVRVEREPKIALSVVDAGPGVTSETKDQIFDAFYTTRSHGAGIGLAVVKRIVDEHARYGATIDVLSPPSGGAEFRVELGAPPGG